MQATDRVHRLGQTRPVLISRFVSAGTVEERMLELRKKTRGVLAAEGEGARGDCGVLERRAARV